MSVIRVFLADDHTILRRGLRSLLDAEEDMEVVGEAEDGREAVEAELLVAIRAVHGGRRYLSPEISEGFIEAYMQRKQDAEDRGFSILTSRERESLQLIAEGKTNKEIAALLKLSVKTVDTHRAHLMEKLQAHSAAQLVLYATRAGLVG